MKRSPSSFTRPSQPQTPAMAGRKCESTMKQSFLHLLVRIENSPIEDVTLKDVRALIGSRDPGAIDVLANLLRDPGKVGTEAARGLARFGRKAKSTLQRCVDDKDKVTAGRARELLSRLGEDEAGVDDVVETMTAYVGREASDNDNDPKAKLRPLWDPYVVRKIARVLSRRGMDDQDLEDGISEVQARILERLRTKPPPGGFEEWVAFATHVARAYAMDQGRRKTVRRQWLVQPTEPEGCAVFPGENVDIETVVDCRRALGVFQELAEAGELPRLSAEIAILAAEGNSNEEIAQKLGLPRETVRDRRRVMAQRMREALMARGLASLVARPRPRRRKESLTSPPSPGRDAARDG